MRREQSGKPAPVHRVSVSIVLFSDGFTSHLESLLWPLGLHTCPDSQLPPASPQAGLPQFSPSFPRPHSHGPLLDPLWGMLTSLNSSSHYSHIAFSLRLSLSALKLPPPIAILLIAFVFLVACSNTILIIYCLLSLYPSYNKSSMMAETFNGFVYC